MDKKTVFKKVKCAVCGSSKYEIVYKSDFRLKDFTPDTFLSRKVPKKSHYRMVKCKECGLLYSNPTLKEKYIDKLYYDAGVPTHQDLENASNVYLFYLKEVLNKIQKSSNILDIGCGNGFFLSRLKRLGYKNVFGVEPSRNSVKDLATGIKSKNIKIGGYERKLFLKDYFDLICFFQVFDHLVDPNKFLKDCFYNLKKGGYIFALMHDTKSPSALILGESSPIIDVQHIYLFDKNNVKRIFENNGFEVEKVSTTFSKYSILYWLKMGPFPPFIKNNLDKFKNNSLLKLSIPLPAGNMAIIARKV